MASTDLVSGTITPAGGSLMLVLYALRVNDVSNLLHFSDAWGINGVNPLTAR